MMNKEPMVQVGILTEPSICFVLHTDYLLEANNKTIKGKQEVRISENKILFQGENFSELILTPIDDNGFFEIKDVTIGKQFHWQRKEDQRFLGSIKLILTKEGITLINKLSIENYLTSVISSEMSATSSKELLKAHAIISRSWLLAQIVKRTENKDANSHYNSFTENEEERICWYDREDHTLFDVCADDHCQRYQGITKASQKKVVEAITDTRGEVLMWNNTICDARFSKCCGGVTEQFESCWEPISFPYLTVLRDDKTKDYPDLTIEANAEEWIRSNPSAFCNNQNPEILSQVLNNYDQETTDFYRWKITYTQSEIAELINTKSGIDFGDILKLVPLKRGGSGRLEKLKIVGSKRTFTIGKELEIRRILSKSHLYSSAFVVETKDIQNNIPQQFILTGAGWGHGVGLCQIGAAVMGSMGYKYNEILTHYYPTATIEKRY